MKKRYRFTNGRSKFLTNDERLIDDGKAQFIDWEQAKTDIARETS